jgi:hypothetical protein
LPPVSIPALVEAAKAGRICRDAKGSVMTIASLKPFLIVLVIGLWGISVTSVRAPEAAPSRLSLGAYFERLVDECQEAHPDWGRDACERIVRGDIWIGMTEEMIVASLGNPLGVEIPAGEDPTHEEWTYRTARYGLELLQVENGILTGWGTPESGCSTCGVKPPRP